MRRFKTTIQVCLGLTSIATSVLLLARMVDWLPDRRPAADALRTQGIQAFASGCTMAMQRGDREMVQKLLEHMLQTVPDLYACQFRTRLGDTFTSGPFTNQDVKTSDFEIPLRAAGETMGTATFRIHQNLSDAFAGVLAPWFLRLVCGFGLINFGFSFLFLRRVLRHLDPSKVVPQRVSSTLDTLAEGLVVLDSQRQIVMANTAFAQIVGASAEDLVGVAMESHAWSLPKRHTTEQLPWVRSLERGTIEAGHLVRLDDGKGNARTFRVNTAPILDDAGECRGALASFDDLTELEERNRTLTRMLATLRASREQIRKQNQELHTLATRDPLTSALNRRSLFRQFDEHWYNVTHLHKSLNCVMVDVDNFKSINDVHGHSTGDYVLKQVVLVLHRSVRDMDLVGRYGGEEFCILMPDISLEEAAEAAERVRHEIAAQDFNGLKVTASFGVAGSCLGADSPQQLTELADKALYSAKTMGRNRVVRADEIPPESDSHANSTTSGNDSDESTIGSPISFQIVAALTSALAYRDASTAEHSRRVADLCVMLGRQLMSLSECYVLENAALLHDIGKIGVPDSILLKPGPLDTDEWSVMRAHDRIGIEIIRSTFACDQLTEMVRWHHTRFDGAREESDTPVGKVIPLGARIITICDAFDAMVSDRVYRQGLPRTDAITELRRCAAKQFDPELVEQFIACLDNRTEHDVIDPTCLTKQTALRLGIEIERLAKALDDRDSQRLAILSQSLKITAGECGITEISALADELVESINKDDEWVRLLQLTIELMEICRQAQRTHLMTAEQPAVCRYVGTPGA